MGFWCVVPSLLFCSVWSFFSFTQLRHWLQSSCYVGFWQVSEFSSATLIQLVLALMSSHCRCWGNAHIQRSDLWCWPFLSLFPIWVWTLSHKRWNSSRDLRSQASPVIICSFSKEVCFLDYVSSVATALITNSPYISFQENRNSGTAALSLFHLQRSAKGGWKEFLCLIYPT